MTWKLTTLNVNGIRSATKKGLHRWRSRVSPDVLALQEVRMQAADMKPLHRAPRGWSMVQADAERKGYAGVALWSRLPVLGTSIGIGLDWADAEGRVVRMDLPQATVVSVYLPSGGRGKRQPEKDAFMAHLYDWAAALLAEGRPVVLCGDLNIAHTRQDIHNPNGNKKTSGFLPHEREWFGRLLDQGWVDVYRHLHPDAQQYSWWSNLGRARELDRGWRLDYHLASPDLAAKAREATIEPPRLRISDHCPVTVVYDD